MTYQLTAICEASSSPPKLPAWVISARAETLENVAFRSGAVLTVLDTLVCDSNHGVPVELLANRMALEAATATSKLEGRLARESDIRDAFHLTPPGEAGGPDGDLLAFWREAARLRLTGRGWRAAPGSLAGPGLEAEVENWLAVSAARARTHGPFAGCAAVIREVLQVDDRAERIACMLSDVILGHALNWKTLLPVSAQGLTKAMLRDLVAEGQGAELKVQQSILRSVEDTIRIARDLSSRAAALRSIAPKLRAKGSEAAVGLFLSEDAVAPSTMLSPMIQGTTVSMTDRAARRFCDRLVELGVAHELTGRPTFRLYGL